MHVIAEVTGLTHNTSNIIKIMIPHMTEEEIPPIRFVKNK